MLKKRRQFIGTIDDVIDSLDDYLDFENKYPDVFNKGDYDGVEDDINDLGRDAEDISPFEKSGDYNSPFEKDENVDESYSNLYLTQFARNNNRAENILLKNNRDITEEEIKRASKHLYYESNDSKLNNRLDKKILGWYSSIYGDDNLKYDYSGKMIDPKLKMPISSTFIKLKTKDGDSLSNGFRNIANQMIKVDQSTIPLNGVFALQKSINDVLGERVLDEDGELGQKTTSRTKEVLVNYGAKTLQQKLAGTVSSGERKDLKMVK